jgi:glucosamine-6-phosphate deaminase
MRLRICGTVEQLSAAAARQAAQLLRRALSVSDELTVVAATGASQIPFLAALEGQRGIDWQRVVFFHLDEYVGLPESHAASFRRYLRERVEERLRPRAFHYIQGDCPDPAVECRRLAGLIGDRTVALAFVGVGENGHLAFNDPPADFEAAEPYLVVSLDEACRMQQVREGWFARVSDVPTQAISMSIRQILKAKNIICVAPDKRKAKAVHECFAGGVSRLHPASILQTHPRCTVYLDEESASLLKAAY